MHTSTLMVEGSLPAAEVKAGTPLLRHTATGHETITGFYVRLANCIGPRDAAVEVALRAAAHLRAERASIPVYGEPLNMYTRQGGRVFPPLDVAQEYRTALAEPLVLREGDTVTLEIVSSGAMAGGVVGGLQFAGRWPLLAMREPFRQTKAAGPVSRIAWSEREVICTGNQIAFDPLCAPQNNSVVVADDDGSLFQFTAYYSVDEQYGGGRDGSISRTYGFRKPCASNAWESLGLVMELPEGITYVGDPFAFRSLDGTPHLFVGVVDGTRGFVDWQFSWGYLLRSQTRSFAGPWGPPHRLWEKFGRGRHDSDRLICARIFPRAKTDDYVLCWLHGGTDICVRGAILPDLDATLTHEQIRSAPILVRNQDEGSGGFVLGDQGYLCSWQIPNVNDVTSIQRLYAFDLEDPLNPERWRVVPGSWGFNDGTHPEEDGGASADCWSLSLIRGELWASSVAWSVTHRRNATLACHVPWSHRFSDTFRYGVSKVEGYDNIAPVVEYALGEHGSLAAEITAHGDGASILLALAPSNRPQLSGGVGIEITQGGTRLVALDDAGHRSELTPASGPVFVPGKPYAVELRRRASWISGAVDGREFGPVAISVPDTAASLAEPLRFKFYGAKGGLYTIRNAYLCDGADRLDGRVQGDGRPSGGK